MMKVGDETESDGSKNPNTRMHKGGDLYIAPLSREAMLAPLVWHEEQLAVVHRYGVLADGAIGYRVVKVQG